VSDPPEAAKKMRRDKWGAVSGLHYFFHGGGIETVVEVAGFELDIDLIREKSKERYEDE